MKQRQPARVLLGLALLVLSVRGTPAEESREEGHRLRPTKGRWKAALVGALRDPATWIPAAGAGVIAAGGWDRTISDWAVEETPVFGSQEHARHVSDDLVLASEVGLVATALAVRDPEAPWKSRFERILVEEMGAGVTTGTTLLLKKVTSRPLPDGSGDDSFPSSHTSRAFALATLSSRNVEAMHLSRAAEVSMKVGLLDTRGRDRLGASGSRRALPDRRARGRSARQLRGSAVPRRVPRDGRAAERRAGDESTRANDPGPASRSSLTHSYEVSLEFLLIRGRIRTA